MDHVERSDIDIVQRSSSFIKLSTGKIVHRLLTMICMIPKVNLGVGEMEFYVGLVVSVGQVVSENLQIFSQSITQKLYEVST